MPARPMYKSPHKKYSKWSRGYLPEAGTQKHSHNDQGDVPRGKKKKMARVKVQTPGLPQGIHVDTESVKRLGLRGCFCGGCYQKNDGDNNLHQG